MRGGFIVFKSEWNDEQIVGPSGYTGGTTEADLPIRWRAVDDDGEIMCRGRCNEAALDEFGMSDPLHCWAMPSLGCTTLEYTSEKKSDEWEVL